MAEIENVLIFRTDTGEAVRTIGELRDNIKAYKDALNEVEIGSKEYDDILKALQINQAALKDAMHATTGEGEKEAVSMETIAKQAHGLGNSYNALVKQMAALDQEFRRTEDVAKRDLIGAQIKKINQELKDMDAQRGKFQRNVGDYFGQALTDNMRKVIPLLQQMPGGFKNVATAATGATNAFAALSATPVIGILTLLAPLLNKVADGIKSDEDATNSWNRALAAFKPISDAFTRSLQSVGAAVAKVANDIVELLYQWGLLDEEAGRHRQAMADDNAYLAKLQRGINLENAHLEETISDLRAKAAERDKYTAKERLAMLEEAAKWQMRIERNNSKMLEERLRLAKEEADLAKNDAATNDKINELEVAVIEQRVKRNTVLRKLNREMSASKAEIARTDAKTAKTQMDTDDAQAESALRSVADIEKALQRLDQLLDQRRQQQAAFEQETAQMLEDINKETTDGIQAELDAQLDAEWDAMMEERRIFQQRVDTFTAFTSGIASLASSLADIYEADSEADEEAAKKAKALKIASTIISTIGGAVSAYTSTWAAAELPVSVKTVLAPINAAAVLAAGYAQVRQMNAVPVGGSGGSGAMVSAPAAPVAAIQQVRTVTGASEVDRLNEAVGNIRAYVVESDITAKQDLHRRRTDEASF